MFSWEPVSIAFLVIGDPPEVHEKVLCLLDFVLESVKGQDC